MNTGQLQTIETFNASADRYERSIAQLPNYNHTYDFLADELRDDQRVLDLACGPANISRYLLTKKKLHITGIDLSDEMLSIAEKNIPDGTFFKQSILDFDISEKADLVLNGFGLPYLNTDQAECCLRKMYASLHAQGLAYVSFMHGNGSRIETPSFSPDAEILIFYHLKNDICNQMKTAGFDIVKEWELDYAESDGSITKDIILIGRK